MAQERKLNQVVVSGIKAVGFTLRAQGVIESPNYTPEHHVELVLSIDDFENKEDYFTVVDLVTTAVRIKATKLIEEGKADELSPKK